MNKNQIKIMAIAGGLMASVIGLAAQSASLVAPEYWVPPSKEDPPKDPNIVGSGSTETKDGNVHTMIDVDTKPKTDSKTSDSTEETKKPVIETTLPVDSGKSSGSDTVTTTTKPTEGSPKPEPDNEKVVLIGAPKEEGKITTVPIDPNNGGTNTGIVPPATGAAGSGVVVVSGNYGVVQPVTGQLWAVVPTTPNSGIVYVAQQFQAQREKALNARYASLEKLQSTPADQRSAVVNEMRAAQLQQASEQRELARQLRNDLRTLREERKAAAGN